MEDLDDDQRRLYARTMEVFAADGAHVDRHLGRVVDAVKSLPDPDIADRRVDRPVGATPSVSSVLHGVDLSVPLPAATSMSFAGWSPSTRSCSLATNTSTRSNPGIWPVSSARSRSTQSLS